MFKRQNHSKSLPDNNDLFAEFNIPQQLMVEINQRYQVNSVEIFSANQNENLIRTSEQTQKLHFKELNSSSIKKNKQPKIILMSAQNYSVQNSENEENSIRHPSKIEPRSLKSKTYAKNYRQKKKQQLKILQQQNRFLKQKIDDLSFRLKQTQIQLNKLKHNSDPNTQNFQSTRQKCLRQMQSLLQNDESNLQRLLQVQKNFKNLNTFNSKHKLDLLNYFMSELLENLINDMGFYFIDSIISKKGLWKENQDIHLRKIDEEVFEIWDMSQLKKIKQFMDLTPDFMLKHMKNFKNLWKKLYQDYLNIINQGFLIQKLCQPLDQKVRKPNCQNQIKNYLKLELYFEKIKYRKDLRQLRGSWFKEFQREQQENRLNRNTNSSKRLKQ